MTVGELITKLSNLDKNLIVSRQNPRSFRDIVDHLNDDTEWWIDELDEIFVESGRVYLLSKDEIIEL